MRLRSFYGINKPCSLLLKYRMRYSFIVIVFIFNTFTLSAQDTSILTEKLSYGVSGYLTIATARKINDGRPPYGIGGDIFAAYRVAPKTYLQSKLGYKRYSYEYDNLTQKRTMEDIHLRLAVKRSLSQSKGLNILLGYEPAFIINAQNKYLGYLDSIPSVYFQRELSNRFSHSIYVGLEIHSNQNSSIDFGYSHTLNKGITNTYFDAIPNHFTIAYNFKFNKTAVVPEDVLKARATLNRLMYDTLYVINRGCPEDYSREQLDSLFSKNYTYSAYKLLKDKNIAQVSKQTNVVHFVIIGNHYSSLADPSSNGIYLLDSKLKSTEYPYPYHTTNPKNSRALSHCFGGLNNTADLIKVFDDRLRKKLEGI